MTPKDRPVTPEDVKNYTVGIYVTTCGCDSEPRKQPCVYHIVRHLAAENARLREAFDQYGCHPATCGVYQRTPEQIANNEHPECTCGLDAALKGE